MSPNDIHLQTRDEHYERNYGLGRFFSSSIHLQTSIAALLITLLISFSLYWNITNLRQEKINLAQDAAEALWKKDAALRQWATSHGGVYVKPDKRTPPNPLLAHLPHRDVETTTGTKLTLMNPAYMMSQMSQDFEELFGIKGRITGKIQLNPNNKPDSWELDAITQFEKGIKKVVEVSKIENQPYLRYMKPMFMTEGCIKCHGHLGFKDGDLRGGVSVSVPLTPYFAAAAITSRSMWITHIIVWFLSMLAIYYFMQAANKRQSERNILIKQLEHDAVHDNLTSLPNRLLFSDRLEYALKQKKQDPSYMFSVCFLDLDRFKNINDSFGHQVGDRLLIQVAKRLENVLRPSDMVARMGGDEFTFLFNDVCSINESQLVAERIIAIFKQPFDMEVGEIYISASIGICMTDAQYTRANDMLRDADIALYKAKDAGRGCIDIFNVSMHEQAIKHMQMENDLRHALENKQLEVYYQPVVDIKNNTIFGFEALIRWKHPNLGFISPEVFIPLAEDTGLIYDIGEWVLEQSCMVVRDWNLEFASANPLCLSVNLSGKQLTQSNIAGRIFNILAITRFDANLLFCEITETAAIQYKEKAINVITELQAEGIGISADDFGKGYSSLTYLQDFNFDTLKIDKDFVQDMHSKGKGLQLVKTMMLLARDFGMKVVAEGVEEEDQLGRLQAMGCELIQGYYFSRPVAASDIYTLLQSGCHLDANKLLQNNTKNAQSEQIL